MTSDVPFRAPEEAPFLARHANGTLLRLAAGGLLPARWFAPPPPSNRAARRGTLSLEVVSHCWQYSRFLAYQLSALAQFPPQKLRVKMTVFYAQEDTQTQALPRLLRAESSAECGMELASPAQGGPVSSGHRAQSGGPRDEGRLDLVHRLRCDVPCRLPGHAGRAAAGAYRGAAVSARRTRNPAAERGRPGADAQRAAGPALVDVDDQNFTTRRIDRATGPMQITHGDVARACGYCPTLRLYQQPADHFCKAYEDRAFRWLLGTQGVGIDVPNVYRLRHATKGRYRAGSTSGQLRGAIRRAKSWLSERLTAPRAR